MSRDFFGRRLNAGEYLTLGNDIYLITAIDLGDDHVCCQVTNLATNLSCVGDPSFNCEFITEKEAMFRLLKNEPQL
jgi:hypothetical protein